MNIFDQYGIKEVADVTLYSIHKKQDGSGDNYFVPALFLDTLKISSYDKTAENVWAEGGQGNGRLISWDFGKRINVSLEDALCTPASLGLCWGGILGADWKDGKVQIKSGVVDNQNIDRISRFEKAYYPRNDKEKGSISNLLPRLRHDYIDNSLDLLRISSVVDGTDIRGFGRVKNHTYQWKLVIESVVSSVAQVPDRFFDINGQSYPIDINRKVSVSSLPTYENYKDAIIYKINSKSKLSPPLAKIIFDDAMESKGQLVNQRIIANNLTKSMITLAELLEAAGYIIHADGTLEFVQDNTSIYYLSLRNLNTMIPFTESDHNLYNYDIIEKLYQILDQDMIASITPETISAAALSSIKITYAENHAMTDLCGIDGQINLDHEGSVEEVAVEREICEADYLAIIVDNNDNYHALIGVYSYIDNNDPKDRVIWYKPTVPVDTSQFRGLDMWLRFSSINEMIYFIITKYNEDVLSIDPSTINANEGNGTWAVDDKQTTLEKNDDSESRNLMGKLWAYVDPKTMMPYQDDYWFHKGENYLIKTLTLARKQQPLKANRIEVKSGVWPGMYMLVGETWIRSYETGKDERMQITIPFCKVKSNDNINLQADGDPVVFSLELEVASAPDGRLVEITTFETGDKMVRDNNGNYYIADGSTEVLYE